jgi:diaminohydroxyphosphoribosylaminopyrimidine deaminase/5-amino-6-(5-phosphoribosylamino)uracil reductase
MMRALELAWRAAGRTDPNPLVGAVVVANGDIIGEGFHHRCGEAHAEVEALGEAGEADERARGGTMYVSLEPCAHHGRTPPCTDRIIAAGVSRVVIPALDPDPKVLGRGVSVLRDSGVRVDVGCLAASAIATNLGYYRQRLGMDSTVTLKMAVTIDGKIASAPGRRDNVTGDEARLYVHRLRAVCDGVVVGLRTVQVDDPQLDCRTIDCGALPVPVVFDSRLQLSESNRWSGQNRPFVVVCGADADAGRKSALESRGGRVLECRTDGHGRVDVDDALRRLSEAGLQRLLVEGGAEIFSSFVNAGAWDAMYLFHSPKVFGSGGVSVFAGTRSVKPEAIALDSVRLDGDFMHRYLNRRSYEEIVARLEFGAGE